MVSPQGLVSRIFCEFVQLSLDIFQLYPYLDTVTLSLCKLTILQKCEVFTNMLAAYFHRPYQLLHIAVFDDTPLLQGHKLLVKLHLQIVSIVGVTNSQKILDTNALQGHQIKAADDVCAPP